MFIFVENSCVLYLHQNHWQQMLYLTNLRQQMDTMLTKMRVNKKLTSNNKPMFYYCTYVYACEYMKAVLFFNKCIKLQFISLEFIRSPLSKFKILGYI